MFSKIFEGFRANRRVRAQDEEFTALSDAALDDLGLTRADLVMLRPRPEPARRERATPDSVFVQFAFPGYAHAA